MKKLKNNFPCLLVLGSRTEKTKIEDTFDTLRKAWFGSSKGFHIDSYKKYIFIDSHKINFKKC